MSLIYYYKSFMKIYEHFRYFRLYFEVVKGLKTKCAVVFSKTQRRARSLKIECKSLNSPRVDSVNIRMF